MIVEIEISFKNNQLIKIFKKKKFKLLDVIIYMKYEQFIYRKLPLTRSNKFHNLLY